MTASFLTRKQVAAVFQISEHTLAKLASQGRGPVYYKPVDKVLYRPEDVETWITSAIVIPSAVDDAAPKRGGRGRSLKHDGPRTLATPREALAPALGRRRKSLVPSAESALRQSGISGVDEDTTGIDATAGDGSRQDA
jgi:hypothetical protein